MKLARAVPVLAVILAACGDSTPLTLRYHPQPGATHSYVLNQDMTMTGEDGQMADMPEQQLGIRIAFTQNVKGPADSGIEVLVRIDSVNMRAPGMPAEALAQAMGMLRGLQSRLVFDDHMKVVSSHVSDAAGVPPQLANQLAAGLRGASFPLPDKPVRMGESWNVEMAAPTGLPGMGQPLMLRYEITLKDMRVDGTDTVVTLAVETTFPKEPINVAGEAGSGTLRVDGSMRGEQKFSVSRGTIVRVDMNGAIKVTTGGGLGEGAMRLQQKLGLELVENGATP